MTIEKLIELILVCCALGATLAFGGVLPLTYSLVEVSLLAALLLFFLKQVRQGEVKLPLPVWPVLFALWVASTLVPLPSKLVGGLSPARLLDSLPGIGSSDTWRALSIHPHDTCLALMKLLAYLAAFLLAAHIFDSRKGKSNLIRALVLLGLFEAGYGIVQYLTGWQKIFTYVKKYDLDEATGTYINRNHFAGLLELTIPFAVASVYGSLRSWLGARGNTSSGRIQRRGRPQAARWVFDLFLVVVMVVAVIFSRSRTGIVVTVLVILFQALLVQMVVGRKVWLAGVFAFLLCVVGYSLWIGLDPVVSRFEEFQQGGGLRMEARVLIWKDAVNLVREYPLFGTGLGTFGVAFRRFQTSLVEFNVDHAHNDYLQIIVETGTLGFLLLFLPILGLFAGMLGFFWRTTPSYSQSVVLGCLGSTLALLLHSFTDFNLEIPANALIFALILGIGYKVSYLEHAKQRRSSPPQIHSESRP